MFSFDKPVIVACTLNNIDISKLIILKLYELDKGDLPGFKCYGEVVDSLETLSKELSDLVIYDNTTSLFKQLYFAEALKIIEEQHLPLDDFDIEQELNRILFDIKYHLNKISIRGKELTNVILQRPNSVFFIYR